MLCFRQVGLLLVALLNTLTLESRPQSPRLPEVARTVLVLLSQRREDNGMLSLGTVSTASAPSPVGGEGTSDRAQSSQGQEVPTL